jgi:hypothetical protein
MFLRSNTRIKDGRQDRCYTVVESRRLQSGKVTQRQVLYPGEINDSQQAAWRRTLKVFDEAEQRYTPLSLFPEDRPVPADAIDSVQVKLSEMKLERARPYGNCWLGCELWRQLQLDRFWSEKLPQGREGVAWPQVLELLVVNRLIDPGSEFRLHRHWFDHSAMDILLGQDFAVAEKDRLYRCLDRVLEHKQDLFVHLQQRWKDLFDAEFDLLLYDLTSTYVEGRSRTESQSEIRLQPRQETGLQAGGDRADRDAGGASAGIRSDGRQHVGERRRCAVFRTASKACTAKRGGCG